MLAPASTCVAGFVATTFATRTRPSSTSWRACSRERESPRCTSSASSRRRAGATGSAHLGVGERVLQPTVDVVVHGDVVGGGQVGQVDEPSGRGVDAGITGHPRLGEG